MKDKLKTLASQTVIYGFLNFFSRFLTFLLTPLYTNFLTKVELSDITNIMSLIAFLNIIYSFGFESAFFRFYDKNDLDYSKKVFSTSFWAIFVISFFTTILFQLMVPEYGKYVVEGENGMLILQLALLLPFIDGFTYIPYSFLRMTNRAKKYSIFRLLQIVFTLILNYIFLGVYNLGALGSIYALLGAAVLGVLLNLKDTFRYVEFKREKQLFWEMIQYGAPTLPASVATIILNLGDRFLVTNLASSEANAIYSTNYKLAFPMMLIVSAFDYAWRPFYMQHHKESDSNKIFSKVLTFFTIVSGLVYLLVLNFIGYIVQIPFIGGKFINPVYWSGLVIIPYILGGYYLNGVFNILATGINIAKKTIYLPIAVGSAAIINIGLNFYFIPHFGYMGAAYTTLICLTFSAILLYIFVSKIYPVAYEWRKIFTTILIAVSIGVVLDYSNQYLNTFLQIAFKILSLLIYLFLLFVFKILDQNEISLIKKFLKRK